ncbi:MAG: hypothetical protein WA622_21910 [Mycobacterium sp.]|uniref:hypothetical protein n=1 Tax=Mycobacterium sp. TaxID=1785 RepID=UPI003BB710C5
MTEHIRTTFPEMYVAAFAAEDGRVAIAEGFDWHDHEWAAGFDLSPAGALEFAQQILAALAAINYPKSTIVRE